MVTEHKFGDIETKNRIIKGALSDRIRDNPSSMFYIWFASNLTVGDFALGFIPVYLGLSESYAILSMVLGTLAGGILLAYMSMLGSINHMPQMEMGKGPFGRIGGSFLALLQWGNTAGWLTVNVILSSFALYEVLKIPYYFIILLIAVIVALTAALGYRAIRALERYMSYVLGILFIVIIIFMVLRHYTLIYSGSSSVSFIPAFGITFASAFSYIMSWGPYASDYSRHQYSPKSSRKVFLFTLGGSALATVFAEIVGMFVAIGSGNPSGNPATDLELVMGSFALAGMISLFLGGISANAINLYSNSLSFIAMGFKTRRITGVIIATLFSVILGIFGFTRFYGFYETFLFVLDYWITPWIGVMIAISSLFIQIPVL